MMRNLVIKPCISSFCQVSEELKELEKTNTEKEDLVKVRKQTIDLLPDSQNNLVKLQVGALPQQHYCEPI